ncbi:MAG: hypothetical protein Q7J03_02245 [Methanoregula sp.]|nr:hypothetical protein [Methanoregula sp.]
MPQTIPLNASPVIDVGVIPIEMPPGLELISFDEAAGNLKDSESLSLNSFQIKPRILFIQGRNLDENGKAGQWIFGINKGHINELRIYDSSGWTIIAWNNTISADEIELDRIITPDILFDQNKIQILKNSPSAIPAQWDIELKNGTYTVMMTSGSTSEILRINAITGAAIE